MKEETMSDGEIDQNETDELPRAKWGMWTLLTFSKQFLW